MLWQGARPTFFMIAGDKVHAPLPFCDVGHGRPDPLDADRAPSALAQTIYGAQAPSAWSSPAWTRDLKDGGFTRFVECIQNARAVSPQTQIEITAPGFAAAWTARSTSSRPHRRRDEPQPRDRRASTKRARAPDYDSA